MITAKPPAVQIVITIGRWVAAARNKAGELEIYTFVPNSQRPKTLRGNRYDLSNLRQRNGAEPGRLAMALPDL